jgi:hypothetical protein
MTSSASGGLLGPGLEHSARGPGQHRDDLDAVRDHVVQLAGHAQPLGHHRACRALLAQGLGVFAPLAQAVAEPPTARGVQRDLAGGGGEVLCHVPKAG